MIIDDRVDQLAHRLGAVGLNRCRAVSTSGLPSDIWLPGHEAPIVSASSPATLILVGHAGTDMWDHLTADNPDRTLNPATDPVDTLSVEATEAAIEEQWPDTTRRLLYPHPECPVDLVVLGRAVGWQSASPLGLGIHPEYGLWSAFRALWILWDELESATAGDPRQPADVCASCVTQDCVAACPVDAVEVGSRFNLTACFGHRAAAESSCALTCLARRACPVGSQYQYSDTQMAYHYGISRPATPPNYDPGNRCK